MVEVLKKEHETASSLVRRFSRSIQQSGILLRARKLRFYRRRPSKTQRREAAMRRIQKQKEYEHLVKMGKTDELENM